MPNLLITVSSAQISSSQIGVVYVAQLDSGQTIFGAMPGIAFGSSSAAINNAIISDAKSQIQQQLGITIGANDKVQLFCGAN